MSRATLEEEDKSGFEEYKHLLLTETLDAKANSAGHQPAAETQRDVDGRIVQSVLSRRSSGNSDD